MDFFCTCGRGTELFAVAEISQLMNEELEKISVRDGKVLFTVHPQIHQASFLLKTLLQLKSIERIFVAVYHQPQMKLFSQKQALWKLKSELQHVDTTMWDSCFQLWKTIQAADESNIPAPVTKICGVVESIADEIPKSDNSEPLDTKVNESSLSSVVLLEKRGLKRRMRDDITFRVSAKCSGAAASWFTPQSLSRVVGCEIARRNGWTPELRRPEFEISVQLNHDGLIVGLPCTRVPLSSRRYMKHPGLRTTISSIMVFLAALKPGMVLLDPMCGMGTILIEAAKQCTNVLCIGCDRDIQQCYRSVENVNYSKESARISLMQADVSDIPLADESIDVVVCDIPFGIKHESPVNVSERYRLMLLSIARVLKCEGRVVLLCGAKLKDALLTSVTELFSSQAHTPCSHCACPLQTSLSPEGINSSDEKLQRRSFDLTCSLSRESHPCENLDEHTGKRSDYKDGSMEFETGSVEKTTSDSVEKTTSDSMEKMRSESVEITTSDSMEKTTSDSMEKTTSDSVEKTTSDSVEKTTSDSVEKTTSESVEKTTSDSVEKTTSDSVKKKTSDSVKKTTSDSVKKMTSDSIGLCSRDLGVQTDHQHVLCATDSFRTRNDMDCYCSDAGNISTVSNSSAFEELSPVDRSTLDTITRLCRQRSPNSFANSCRSQNCSAVSRNIWVRELVHYVKLGETHAFICVFSTAKT